MTQAYKIIDHTYDVVEVGAGGAGLRATLGLAEKGLNNRIAAISAFENCSFGLSAPIKGRHKASKEMNMGFRHKNWQLFGLQFHPESILSENGRSILNNWIKTCS